MKECSLFNITTYHEDTPETRESYSRIAVRCNKLHQTEIVTDDRGDIALCYSDGFQPPPRIITSYKSVTGKHSKKTAGVTSGTDSPYDHGQFFFATQR
jgi:hypothetical protein